MFFAALDYACYRARWGRYSDRAIRRTGARRAVQDIRADLEGLQPADTLIVHRARSFFSWIIMYMTNSVWSHTALLDGKGYVIHATTAGVLKQPASVFLDGESYLLLRRIPGLQPRQAQKMLDWAEARIGTPYGYCTAIRLGLWIALGFHSSFHWRLGIDVTATLAAIGFLLGPTTAVGRVLFALALAYATLVTSLALRRVWIGNRMRRLQHRAEDGNEG